MSWGDRFYRSEASRYHNSAHQLEKDEELREEIDNFFERYIGCVERLQAENDKLRELVRDMWEFGFGSNSGANDAWAWHERTDELEDRMRELGVDA